MRTSLLWASAPVEIGEGSGFRPMGKDGRSAMPHQDGNRKGCKEVRIYYVECEREIAATRIILESLVKSDKTFGEHLQCLYRQLMGAAFPGYGFSYDPNTSQEDYWIRISAIQYARFLDRYWAVEKYIPLLEKEVDPKAIALYREIGTILVQGVVSGTEEEGA